MLDKVRGMGKTQLDSLAGALLKQCQKEGLLPEGEVNWELFHTYREHIRTNFYVPQTSITTLTSRVLYGTGYLAQPSRLVGIGTYYGNAICWLAGAGFSPLRIYEGGQACAIDIDQDAMRGFVLNRNQANLTIEDICTDGMAWLSENTTSINLLYLDIDTPENGKKDYLTCFEKAKEQLPPGSLIVAHDYYEEKFADDMRRFREGVIPHTHKFLALQTDKYGLAMVKI